MYQIGNKTCYIQKVRKFYLERVYIYVKDLQVSYLSFKCVRYCQEYNAKGTDPMELNFERLEIPK